VKPIDAARRVRAGFRKAAVVVTATLLPFLIHAAWGYVETRRLNAAIQSIEARGEPVRTELVRPVGDAAAAARYYRAAAALASDFRADPRPWYGDVTAAERTGNWPDDLLARIRGVISPYEEMLSLIDRAADLPFEDFEPGTTYNYLAQGLMQSSRISSLRSIVQAFEGDAAGAARSLHSALQAGRWFTRNGGSFSPSSMAWFTSALQITLQRVRPQDIELERLARDLADADEDDVLRRAFLGMRAGMLSRVPANPWFIGNPVVPLFVVDRPWRTHQVNRQLSWYAAVLSAIDVPWPDRIDAVGEVDYFNLDAPITRERMLKSVEYMVTPVAMVRTLRTAIAVERYRRGHSEQMPASLSELSPWYLETTPVDPFTGRPLLFAKTPSGYVVYSAGVNRTNDNGDVSAQWAGGSDLGITVRDGRR
jgi:hypothetical protein